MQDKELNIVISPKENFESIRRNLHFLGVAKLLRLSIFLSVSGLYCGSTPLSTILVMSAQKRRFQGIKPTETEMCTEHRKSGSGRLAREQCGSRGGHSLVSSVPMRDQKNDEKGYFFSRRAVRSADII